MLIAGRRNGVSEQGRIDNIGRFLCQMSIIILDQGRGLLTEGGKASGSAGKIGDISPGNDHPPDCGMGGYGRIAVVFRQTHRVRIGYRPGPVTSRIDHRHVGSQRPRTCADYVRLQSTTSEPFLAVAHFQTGRTDHIAMLTHTMTRTEIDIGDPDPAHITEIDIQAHVDDPWLAGSVAANV